MKRLAQQGRFVRIVLEFVARRGEGAVHADHGIAAMSSYNCLSKGSAI
jgi:hypothetical protein